VVGPMPRRSLEALLELGDRVLFIRGNTDRAVVRPIDDGWRERYDWVRGELGEEQVAAIAEWPETAVVEIEGLGPTLFCHGSPRSDEEILTRATSPERLGPILAGVEEDVVVCGHTHVQFDRTWEGKRLVNAGSVGMPYEGRPGAHWALLGPDVELRRTPYDVEEAAEHVRVSGMPEAEQFAADYVLSAYTAEEATEQFERMASGP
jgi:diadenosine tetraphosphatase ApaH/serine/threonine PP2A family protein phosphatase